MHKFMIGVIFMRKLIVICSVLLATVGCAQKEATVQSPAAVQAPSMTEIAEANPTYWGYIDYLWAKNGESFSEDAFAAYLADWLTEADATNVPYNSFGYVPVTPNEDFDGVWAVAWKSKALRDEAWKNWMANESTEKLTSTHSATINLGGENYENVFGFYAFRPREMSNPWISEIGPDQTPYNVDIQFCNFNDGQGFDQLKDVVAAEFSPWLDAYDKKHPAASYNFSIEVPANADATFDYIWKNIHRNTLQANEGNAAWAETGGDIQAKFDAVAVCQPPGRFAGYSFRDYEEA